MNMNHETAYYVAAFMAAIGAAVAFYISFLVIRHFVREFFEVLLLNVLLPLIKLVLEPVVAFKRQLQFNKGNVKTTPVKAMAPKNRRLASAKRVRLGEALMEIPAYARKETGIGYPMNQALLKQPRYIVKRDMDLENLKQLSV